MEKTITLDQGQCELVTRLATRAIAEGDLQQQEEQDAQAVREKIVNAETILVI